VYLSSLDIIIFKAKIGLNSVPENRKEESQSFGSIDIIATQIKHDLSIETYSIFGQFPLINQLFSNEDLSSKLSIDYLVG
jgi:hypothetical protein